ncbi:MAG: glycosyltransferase [Flavobacteriales bacterium]|nr:glycosyltransferase [Flavobacteriales bacterium]
MKKRIVVSVNNNLTYDQRVQKVCNTLYSEGYELVLIGNTLRGIPECKRKYFVHRIPVFFQKTFFLYAEFNLKLFFYLLLNAKKRDILLANDLDTLLPNYLISKIKKLDLVFDSHEYFSELPAVQGRFSQKIWQLIERSILPKLKKVITVSDGIKNEYYKLYNINAEVIRNVPKTYAIQNQPQTHHRKFIIYQGAINPFRGIDKMILAMQSIDDVDLIIAGDGPMLNEYKKLVIDKKLNHKVFFYGNVTPEKLREITPQAELGLSLEENAGKSYYFALPNKLFDYIHAEIPILGTYMPEIKSIIEDNDIGICIKNHDIKEIESKIKELLSTDKINYLQNLKKAKQKYCWENQEEKLLSIFR